jgi:ADP-ribosylglycohydrolase
VLGAIVGDFVGSVHEFNAPKTKEFPLLDPRCRVTDDSILTVVVGEWILHRTDLVTRFHEAVAAYPDSGWGVMFHRWATAGKRDPYHSYGNGSAMRVSAVGWAYDTLDETLSAAADSAAVTHNHPEGIKGAQATAAAVFLARTTRDKAAIRREVTGRFGYDLGRTVDEIRPDYRFNETCQRTVPEAITAFLESSDYEDAIRTAISLGGDADTLAAITGAIAHAFYHDIPAAPKVAALAALPAELRVIWNEFAKRYAVPA